MNWINFEGCDIEIIIPCKLPFKESDKIFNITDDEGNVIGDKYSLNDFIKEIENISGVNEDLLCPS